jgi:hypothetical protein
VVLLDPRGHFAHELLLELNEFPDLILGLFLVGLGLFLGKAQFSLQVRSGLRDMAHLGINRAHFFVFLS